MLLAGASPAPGYIDSVRILNQDMQLSAEARSEREQRNQQMQAVIHRIGKAERYDYILDTAQETLVYHDPEHDNTAWVLAELGRVRGR